MELENKKKMNVIETGVGLYILSLPQKIGELC